MSLEQALAANTEAVNRLATIMSTINVSVPAGAPAPTMPQAAPQQAMPMQQPPVGMPGAPFPGAGMPQTQAQPAPAQLPFTDAQGLLAWAMAKYNANQSIGEAMGKIITAHGLANITDAQPAQFASLYQQINAL